MKTIPAALKTHLAKGTTTLAHLVKLTRRDGAVLAVTLDHDRELTVGGVVYQPAYGLVPSTVETTSALNVDNMDAVGALMALGVREKDIAAGLWDGCDVRVIRVNWADLSQGVEIIKRGTFGELVVGRGAVKSEIRGLTQALAQTLGEVVSPSCKADLFDAKCGIVATEGQWKFSDVAVTMPLTSSQFVALALDQAGDFFTGGKLVWSSGDNEGLTMEIKQHAEGGGIILQQAMPYQIQIGDTAVFYAGCMKRATEDCSAKFDNIIRFRGFPTVPGNDAALRGP